MSSVAYVTTLYTVSFTLSFVRQWTVQESQWDHFVKNSFREISNLSSFKEVLMTGREGNSFVRCSRRHSQAKLKEMHVSDWKQRLTRRFEVQWTHRQLFYVEKKFIILKLKREQEIELLSYFEMEKLTRQRIRRKKESNVLFNIINDMLQLLAV